MSTVRTFRSDDLNAVMGLRLRAFEEHRRPVDIARTTFRQLFLDGPLASSRYPSLVAIDGTGRIVGFVGRLLRPYRWGEEGIDVVVTTQLMVDPGVGPLPALALLRESQTGGQALTLTDVASSEVRAVWKRLGGREATSMNLRWQLSLRPVRYSLSGLGRDRVYQALRFGLRPVTSLLDRRILRRCESTWHRKSEGVTTRSLPPEAFAAHLRRQRGPGRLVPDYDEADARFVFDQLRERTTIRELRCREVSGPSGPVGMFIVAVDASGMASVVHFSADNGHVDSVWSTLLQEVASTGALAIEGRRNIFPEGDAPGPRPELRLPPPWVLVHSQDPELLSEVESGRAIFERTEGEWWIEL